MSNHSARDISNGPNEDKLIPSNTYAQIDTRTESIRLTATMSRRRLPMLHELARGLSGDLVHVIWQLLCCSSEDIYIRASVRSGAMELLLTPLSAAPTTTTATTHMVVDICDMLYD